mmetsp:Transcript_25447/g.37596  ORF Transcript_25447/g.37596 Transcript_25447/m.37596 type:complete len:378 (+) Transcript_25447:68-1201(+)
MPSLSSRELLLVLLGIVLVNSVSPFAAQHKLSKSKLRWERISYNESFRLVHEVSLFYKNNYRRVYAAKPGDSQHSLICEHSNEILGTVRLSQKVGNKPYTLLSLLCVSKKYRRQGIALDILKIVTNEATAQNENETIYCFAEPSILPLYAKAGFSVIHEAKGKGVLPKSLRQKYASLSKKVAKQGKHICCFEWKKSPISILLLQHEKETRRKTGTAPLLYDLPQYLHITNCTWSGRADNAKVESILQHERKYNQNQLVVLWTGGSHNASSFISDDKTRCTFILLDGTWQEAQSMFRKLHILRELPRLSIKSRLPSNYSLRGNYGWRDRFTSLPMTENNTLLCTAEAAAELLQHTGLFVGARMLKQRLKNFTETYRAQ